MTSTLTPSGPKSAYDLIAHISGVSSEFRPSHSINELSNVNLQFPIIADRERKVAVLYDMLDQQDATNVDTKGS
jgi:alkyl hydroperoxide reductase subunit AhpC